MVLLCALILSEPYFCAWGTGCTQVKAAEEIGEYDLYAKAAVLMDGDSTRVLYGKNENIVLPMASTTKIMTCIVALEQHVLEEEVMISAYAAAQPKVHLGMRKGESFVLKDLLYSLMLESHNDSAVAIAEHIGAKFLDLPEAKERSSEESKAAVAAFAKLMNEKAGELGCEDTYFVTPNGLDGSAEVSERGETVTKHHGTTATDLARIMCYCAWESLEKENFLAITRQKNYSFSNVAGNRSFSCVNHNTFLDQMSGALTGKTGFTNAAGYCYVGALERDGEKYVVALLACGWPSNKNWKWSDTKKLMNYGLENYEQKTGSDYAFKEENLPVLTVAKGQTQTIGGIACIKPKIVPSPNAQKSFLLRSDEKISVQWDLQENLQAPVKAGEQVGRVQYILGHELLWEEEIVVPKDIPVIDFWWCIDKILSKYCIM